MDSGGTEPIDAGGEKGRTGMEPTISLTHLCEIEIADLARTVFLHRTGREAYPIIG